MFLKMKKKITKEDITKEELKEKLLDVRAAEILARKNYVNELLIFSDLETKEEISKIKKDEDRQINILI